LDIVNINELIGNIELFVNKICGKIKKSDIKELRILKTKCFGKNGIITNFSKSLPQYNVSDRKKFGLQLNKAKKILEDAIVKRIEKSKSVYRDSEPHHEKLSYSKDFCFPFPKGSLHPIIQTIQDIIAIFKSLGFAVVDGPELETDWYNFEALNIPEDHPSRDVQDTFYLNENGIKKLLRTHTSPGQIHIMEKQLPPIKIIVPGRVYRNETSDASHSSIFYQIEGLEISENITFMDLKAVLVEFINRFFMSELNLRFRPSYFQFTEPSAEVDIQCNFCKGKGCKICKNLGWMEVLGCGMVHPNVLKSVNYDFQKYIGYAFGIGVERITMLKHNINDIRLFYENDLRFLKQF
jgi:phenylalanyl-tRNA synthetase alpha chain